MPTGDVDGKLTLQGEPVKEGSVVFFKEAGVPVGVGQLGPTGEFRFDKPIPVGKYQVVYQPGMDEAPAGAPATDNAKPPQLVPSKYWSEATSDLSADVKEGRNSFALDMQ